MKQVTMRVYVGALVVVGCCLCLLLYINNNNSISSSYSGIFFPSSSSSSSPSSSSSSLVVNVVVEDGKRRVGIKLTQEEVKSILEARKAAPTNITRGNDGGGCNRGVGGSTWHPPSHNHTHTPAHALATLNLSSYHPQARVYLKEHLQELTNRTLNLTRRCAARPGLTSTPPRPLHLLHHHHQSTHTLLCPIYQVAPAEWMRTFLSKTIDGKDTTGTQQEEGNGIFEKSLRILLVRHPFTRLVNTYLGLIKQPGSSAFKRAFGETGTPGEIPSFLDFVRHLLQKLRHIHSADEWLAQDVCWLPYWVTCDVCTVEYDLVLKAETIQRDRKFLRALVAGRLDSGEEVQLEDLHEDDLNLEEEGVLAKYLHQLDMRDMNFLMDLYVLDLVLFDYQKETFFHYASNW